MRSDVDALIAGLAVEGEDAEGELTELEVMSFPQRFKRC
jgi:hypothetical protein